MFKKVTYGFMLLLAVLFTNQLALAEDGPTLDQVYKAAQAGKMDEAMRMMDVVLKDHPNSAKAHFVEAELLAKQGQLGKAQDELNTAERLKPGLPFAKPQAVQDLKTRLTAPRHASSSQADSFQTPQTSSFPWGMLAIGVGVTAILFFIMRALTNRNNTQANYQQAGYQPGGMQRQVAPMQGTNPAYGGGMGPQGGMAPMAPAGGGMASGIMGGLATGAAVGVGMVAGEALAHHFMESGHNTANAAPVPPVADSWGDSSNNNMGGSDFGIADNSSWGDNANVADNSSDDSGGDWG
jgi:hypothetical protein